MRPTAGVRNDELGGGSHAAAGGVLLGRVFFLAGIPPPPVSSPGLSSLRDRARCHARGVGVVASVVGLILSAHRKLSTWTSPGAVEPMAMSASLRREWSVRVCSSSIRRRWGRGQPRPRLFQMNFPRSADARRRLATLGPPCERSRALRSVSAAALIVAELQPGGPPVGSGGLVSEPGNL